MAQKAIVGEKVGMTQVWTQDRRVVPVTVLRVEPLRIVQIKTKESDGYCALQVTYGTKDARNSTRLLLAILLRTTWPQVVVWSSCAWIQLRAL